MKTFADEVAAIQATKRGGSRCTAGRYLDTLDSKQRGEVEDILAQAVRGEVMFTTLSEVFAARGVHLRGQTISRHARRLCGCPR